MSTQNIRDEIESLRRQFGMIETFNQDLDRLAKQVSSLNQQVLRVHRQLKTDEWEQDTKRDRETVDLLNQVGQLTTAVQNLVQVTHRMNNPQEDMGDGWYAMKRSIEGHVRKKQVMKELDRIRMLQSCKRKLSKNCPVPEHDSHKGIVFLDEEGNVIERRCPHSWWLSLGRLANHEGRLNEFNRTHELAIYMETYKK